MTLTTEDLQQVQEWLAVTLHFTRRVRAVADKIDAGRLTDAREIHDELDAILREVERARPGE